MHLTRAGPEDAPAVARVHVEAWKAAYVGIVPAEVLSGLTVASRQALWQESISRGSPELVIAKENGEVIGFISFGACRDAGVPDSVAEIWALYVLPDQGSRGVGRRLWLHARERLLQLGYESVRLWVFAENTRGIHFYRTAGFVLDPVETQQTVLGGKSLLEVRYVCELT